MRRGRAGIDGTVVKAAAVKEPMGHEVFEVGLAILTVEGEAEGAPRNRR